MNESVLTDVKALLRQLSGDDSQATKDLLKKLIANPAVEIWVVRDGLRIVGMGTLIMVPMLSGVSADIEDVVVDDRYRGRKLGEAIVKKLIARGWARGGKTINLTSRPSRIAANALYQKLGFKQRKTNVYRLEPGN